MSTLGILSGKMSVFGGPKDTGMTHAEGLALYEHPEADLRPDLFLPRDPADPDAGTSQRLRPDALYLAVRFEHARRATLQLTPWIVRNSRTMKMIAVSLCDWGPHERTLRVADLSPTAAALLELQTDDCVSLWPCS